MNISIRDLESVLKEHLNDILLIEVGQIQPKLGHTKYLGAAAISEIMDIIKNILSLLLEPKVVPESKI